MAELDVAFARRGDRQVVVGKLNATHTHPLCGKLSTADSIDARTAL
jgi:hypothetical protein